MIEELLRGIAYNTRSAGGTILLCLAWTLLLSCSVALTWLITSRVVRSSWTKLLPEQTRATLREYQARTARLERDLARARERERDLLAIVRSASMEASHLLINLQGGGIGKGTVPPEAPGR